VLLHYLGKQETRMGNCIFSLKCCKNTRNTLKYHLVTAEPPFTAKTINCVHQTGPKKHSILLSVSHTLYVNQVCHGINRCVKDRSCSLLSLEWKSVDAINRIWWISYYLNKCWTLSDTSQMTIFLSERQLCACNTVQLLQRSRLIQRLSEKCDFRVFPFCQVVQKHNSFEVAY